MSAQVSADLAAVRALIATEETWTQKVWARNAYGKETWFGDYQATCWCLDGAMLKVCNGGGPRRDALLTVVSSATLQLHHFPNIAHLNDTLGHAAVLRVIDHAIAGVGR